MKPDSSICTNRNWNACDVMKFSIFNPEGFKNLQGILLAKTAIDYGFSFPE
jgi:hypothetical protein